MTSCAEEAGDLGVVFRTDAKAEGEKVVVGGWRCAGGVQPVEAGRFSIDLSAANAPWLFCRGEPFRIISSLELLATLLGVMLFLPKNAGAGASGIIAGSAFTDNLGNTYAVSRLMTSSFPLCVFLMELSEQLDRRSSWLQLHWVPRQQNEEADELTNGRFEKFDPSKRIQVDLCNLDWVLLYEFLEAGEGLVPELRELREARKKDRLAAGQARAKKKAKGVRLRDTDPW